MITFSKITLLIIIFILIFILIEYLKLNKKNIKLKKYLHNYLNLIISARYGNLNLRCEAGFNDFTKQLSKNTNAFLESVFDRDIMINEYIEKERQSQNLKQDFISTLAHDFKVPIIAQDNTYDLFLNGNFGELTQIQKHAIENLKISNNDLKNLIIDLLDAHKIERRKLELNIENINLNNLIKETIEQNQSILKIKGKEINFIEKEKINYKLDAFLIKRALNNLISNAIYYGKNSKNIEIILNKNENNIEISIIDEGEGIKEDLNKIFKKYYTASKKYSNIGVGLGLYIVNKIITAHKGKITAKNIENRGACFIIELPLT